MRLRYTSEVEGTEREIYTFEIIGRGEVELVDYEKMVRKNMMDGSWKKLKKKALKEVEVPSHIYEVIYEKLSSE